MNQKKLLIGFIGLLLLFQMCEALAKGRWRVRIRIGYDKKKRALMNKAKRSDYSFDIPCNLTGYDADNNDLISVLEFAEALREDEANVGVRELFVLIDKNGDGVLDAIEIESAKKC